MKKILSLLLILCMALIVHAAGNISGPHISFAVDFNVNGVYNDETNFGYTGQVLGSISNVPAKIGNGTQMNDLSSNVNWGNLTNVNLNLDVHNLTVAMFSNASGAGGFAFGKMGTPSTANKEWWIGKNGGTDAWQVGAGNGTTQWVANAAAASIPQLVCVVGIWDRTSGTVQLWINATNVANGTGLPGTGTNLTSANTAIRTATRTGGSSEGVRGIEDQVVIWDIALNQAQISDYCNNGLGQTMTYIINGTPSVSTNLTIQVNDTRSGLMINGFSWNYTTTNGSDTNAKTGVCSSTLCSITNFTGTVNISVWNVSGNTYFIPYDTPKNNIFYNSSNGLNVTFNTFKNSFIVNITNIVNNTGISSFCVQETNNTDTQTNCTSNGNISFYNISGNTTLLFYNISGGTYFNISQNPGIFNATDTSYVNSTYQALLSIETLQLFTNNTIPSFNITNWLLNNNSPVLNTSTIPANNGTNNLQVSVAGNYTQNITCTINTPLTTGYCNATGIYDDQFTIGATFNGAGIGNFNVSIVNTSLGGTLYNLQTTNGSIMFPLLQGYFYTFNINPPAYSINNATLPANASTNLYNFTVLQQNSFELHFYNETTDTQLTNLSGTVTVQLISPVYSQNYTTNNGTLLVTLLTPSAYTITYWLDPTVPRNYYITLTNQSYNNLSLYIVDTGISSTYLPIVNNEYTRPLSGVTISLLRAFIENNVYVYHVVEMETTDTNGQAVLRVVPNYINYKLLLSYGTASVMTAPTKFTANTNAYTLSLSQNALTSIVELPSVSKSLTFNNATNTYTFTWTDTQNLITSGCMNIQKYNSTGTYTVQNSCTTGGTGSIIYTITDTNNTRYSASATLNTNTQYSTYFFGPVSVDFTNTATSIFGLTGLILLSILLVTVGFMANENGTDSLIITTLIGMVLFGVVGIVFYTWEAYIGIIILGIIYIYKTNG